MLKYEHYLVCFAQHRTGHNFILKNIHDPKYKIIDLDFSPVFYKERVLIGKGIAKNTDIKILVTITRDFLNWIASAHNFSYVKGKRVTHKDYIKGWTNITREGFGETNFLNNSINIVYDKFIEDEDYRLSILRKFGKDRAEFWDYIPGQGSSFSDMDVLNRYKDFYNDEDYYLHLFRKNPEAIEVYRRNFEISEEKEKILNLI